MALFVSQHLYSFSVVHCNDTIEVKCFSIDSFWSVLFLFLFIASIFSPHRNKLLQYSTIVFFFMCDTIQQAVKAFDDHSDY